MYSMQFSATELAMDSFLADGMNDSLVNNMRPYPVDHMNTDLVNAINGNTTTGRSANTPSMPNLANWRSVREALGERRPALNFNTWGKRLRQQIVDDLPSMIRTRLFLTWGEDTDVTFGTACAVANRQSIGSKGIPWEIVSGVP